MPHLRSADRSFTIAPTRSKLRAFPLAFILAILLGCGVGGINFGQNGPITVAYMSATASTVAPGTSVTLAGDALGITSSPIGPISFYDGATLLGTGNQTSSAYATLTTTFTTPGVHNLTASFAGSSGFAGSTSAIFPLTVAPTTSSPVASGGATSIYVSAATVGGYSSLLQLSAASNGTVTPTSTITLPIIGSTPAGLAVDAQGQLYVGGYVTSSYQVLIYAAGATGSATPIRTIVGSASSFAGVNSLAVDNSGNVYVASASSTGTGVISVFSPTATGTATPTRQITGSSTGLATIQGLAIDGAGNLYVGTYAAPTSTAPGVYSIAVFPPSASGNTAPSRTILAGTAISFSRLAVDTAGDVYVIESSQTSPVSYSLVEYAAGASGTATPIRTIAGSATGLIAPLALSVDAAGNVDIDNSTNGGIFAPGVADILIFGPAASGNTAPGRMILSSAWPVASSGVIAVH